MKIKLIHEKIGSAVVAFDHTQKNSRNTIEKRFKYGNENGCSQSIKS